MNGRPSRPCQLITQLETLPKELRGGIVAIGNFDGIHRGHQTVLRESIELASQSSRPALMMTFEPHPRTFFRPETPVFRLNTLEQKRLIAHALGLDGVLCLPFTRQFANQSASAFVSKTLVDNLDVHHVVTGFDFHFGKGREGTPEYLKNAGYEHNFGVDLVSMYSDSSDETISSSCIRSALRDGNVKEASRLLGYRWFVSGEVQHGEKRGRELGFPTANICLSSDCELRFGIYAVTLTMLNGSMHNGVASYGRRPTFDNGAPLLEIFVFDFDQDLYGQNVHITFHDWIRGEVKFDNTAALVAQMNTDCELGQQLLHKATSISELDARIKSNPGQT